MAITPEYLEKVKEMLASLGVVTLSSSNTLKYDVKYPTTDADVKADPCLTIATSTEEFPNHQSKFNVAAIRLDQPITILQSSRNGQPEVSVVGAAVNNSRTDSWSNQEFDSQVFFWDHLPDTAFADKLVALLNQAADVCGGSVK